MARAVPYLRVSTDDQAQSGAGLAAQLDACRAAAAREGWEPLGAYSDEGVSGAAGLADRPGLLAALAALAPGDVLLVAKRDRLGRDPIVVAMIEADVRRRGCRVASAAGEGTDGDGPSDVLMRRLVDAFAEYERLVIKARTRAALAAKRARSERTGGVPLGSSLDGSDARRSKSDRPAALVPCPLEIEALAVARRLRAQGWTIRAIGAELCRLGFEPKLSARGWAPSTLHKYLASERGDS